MIHTLRKQTENRGVFFEIDLECSYSDQRTELSIVYNADLKWKQACELGVHIFHDYYKRKFNNRHLEVKVNAVQWLPVDTNHLIVVYAVVSALAKELDYPISNLNFENDSFSFPEVRSIDF